MRPLLATANERSINSLRRSPPGEILIHFPIIATTPSLIIIIIMSVPKTPSLELVGATEVRIVICVALLIYRRNKQNTQSSDGSILHEIADNAEH